MINFFDNIRYWGTKRNTFLQRLGYYRGRNFFGQFLGNFLLPIYFKLTNKFSLYHLKKEQKDEKHPRIIVSLTSFPARIKNVWLVIESILRQTTKPDKLLLCLTRSQISSISSLPKELIALQERGLEIVFCDEEIRSHTKYWNAFRDNPDDIVITVDDDIIYRSDLIEVLISYHRRFPNAIIVNWAKVISQKHDGLSTYNSWRETNEEDIAIERPNYSLFGVAGVLYPPHSMFDDCLDTQLIKRLCLTADDVWLSAQAILKGTKFVFTGYKQNHLPVSIKNNETLLSINSTRNQVQVQKINDYYENKIGYRLFDRFAEADI